MSTAATAIAMVCPTILITSTHSGQGPPHQHQLSSEPQGSRQARPRLQGKFPPHAASSTDTKPSGSMCSSGGVNVSTTHIRSPQPTQTPRWPQNSGGDNGHCAR
jgi:hypothetical protein